MIYTNVISSLGTAKKLRERERKEKVGEGGDNKPGSSASARNMIHTNVRLVWNAVCPPGRVTSRRDIGCRCHVRAGCVCMCVCVCVCVCVLYACVGAMCVCTCVHARARAFVCCMRL